MRPFLLGVLLGTLGPILFDRLRYRPTVVAAEDLSRATAATEADRSTEEARGSERTSAPDDLSQLAMPELDHVICYQSRVTPQKWIGPSTEDELERAAHDKVAVLVCPIAFVSEHSETLVELDVEYREEAERLGVPGYFRVPAQNSDPGFIADSPDKPCHPVKQEGAGKKTKKASSKK